MLGRVPRTAFSTERRPEPQITVGSLTDASGSRWPWPRSRPTKAETATMLPVITAFKATHQLTDVTVVAEAGMISAANQVAPQAAGLSFVLGTRIAFLPDVVGERRNKHPDEAIPDGLVLTQPWPSTSSDKALGIPDRVLPATTGPGGFHPAPPAGTSISGSTSKSSPRPFRKVLLYRGC
jgi:hypothetical protein